MKLTYPLLRALPGYVSSLESRFEGYFFKNEAVAHTDNQFLPECF